MQALRTVMTRKSAAVAAALLLLVAGAADAATSAQKCQAQKNKVAGAYYQCREKAEAKGVLKGLPPDHSKCSARFDSNWDRAEGKGLGACPDNELTADMNAFLATQASEAAARIAGTPVVESGGLLRTGQTTCDQGAMTFGPCPGSPAGQDGAVGAGLAPSYVDNGDGTITEEVTGLMWEKLSNDGSVHDFDNTYSWTAAFGKISSLNAGAGFAGHTDWRLPNRRELESLMNTGLAFPTIDPVFNTACPVGCTVTTCSCTKSFWHWSSSNFVNNPTMAWYLHFGFGEVQIQGKTINNVHARAVRGGL